MNKSELPTIIIKDLFSTEIFKVYVLFVLYLWIHEAKSSRTLLFCTCSLPFFLYLAPLSPIPHHSEESEKDRELSKTEVARICSFCSSWGEAYWKESERKIWPAPSFYETEVQRVYSSLSTLPILPCSSAFYIHIFYKCNKVQIQVTHLGFSVIQPWPTYPALSPTTSHHVPLCFSSFLSSYPSCIYHIFILMLLLTEFLLLKTPFLLPHVLKFQLCSSLKVQVNPLSSIDHLWFLPTPWEKLFLQYMSGPKLGWWIQS